MSHRKEKFMKRVLSALLAAVLMLTSTACKDGLPEVTTTASSVSVTEKTDATTAQTDSTSGTTAVTTTTQSTPETIVSSDETTAATTETTDATSVTTKKPADTTAKTTAKTEEKTTAKTTAKTTDKTTAKTTEVTTEGIDSSSPGATGGFMVSGNKLYDANGNEFIMRGINHSHTWFAVQSMTVFKSIANTGANCVRIVLSDGEQWTKDSASTVFQLIEKCKDNDLVAIVEVHDATGSNDTSTLESAVDYWIDIKDALIGNEAYAILNIANEWLGNSDTTVWKQAYCKAIKRLREAGIKNTIMVDAGGWGQHGACIAEAGKEVFNSDPLKNTMFSVHMYTVAGASERSVKNIIDNALAQGICLCIGEFGWKHTSRRTTKDVAFEYIMEYCTELGVGYLAWSWKGNSTDVAYLDLAVDWKGETLSPEWGEIVVNGKNGLKATSKICSVYK